MDGPVEPIKTDYLECGLCSITLTLPLFLFKNYPNFLTGPPKTRAHKPIVKTGSRTQPPRYDKAAHQGGKNVLYLR